jgi:arylsulfatase A-like enzyme
VVVVVDDLDVLTAAELPRLGGLVAGQGLTFSRAFAAQPLCAPSRATLLTGQYPHNHGVIDVAAPDQGFPAFRRHESQTLATWLKAAGYRTSLVGKYLNAYPWDVSPDYVPPGWDDWYGHITTFEDERYFDYWVNDNGSVSRFGNRQEDYSVDLEAKRAIAFIRASQGRPEPLFLWLAPQSPHAPAYTAERFSAEFRHSLAPRPPSFNEGDVRDKPAWVRQITPLQGAEIERLDQFQRGRLRSMRAVEEQIDGVLQALAETGRLSTTYVFFTSDNGLLMGQHRAAGRKANAYEESARVPFAVRGPGVPVGQVDALVVNVDLAPTLLELAGARIPDTVDGRSLVPFLRGRTPSSWRQEALVENGGTLALRTPEWSYIHNDSDELELYELASDPWQLESQHKKADPALLDRLEKRLRELAACRGPSCRGS